MSTTLVHRPARHTVPDPGRSPLVIATPPQLPENPPAAGSSAMIMMPIITGSGSLLMTITLGNRPLFAVIGAMVMMASVAVGIVMFVAQRNGPRRRIREQRERYLDYLDHLRETVREVAGLQRAAALFRHPAPHLLAGAARLPARRWERRVGDPDFLHVRVGEGTRPLARRLSLNIDRANPLVVYDPVCQGIAEQLVDLYAEVAEQPLVLPLRECGVVSVVGDRAAARGVARAVAAQLATFSAPGDVRLGVVRHQRLVPEWDWFKWLPHNSLDGVQDGPLPARLVAANTVEMTELLSAEIEQRTIDLQRRRGAPPGPGTARLVVVVDGEFQATLSGLAAEPPVHSLADIGIHLVFLVGERREEPGHVDTRLYVEADGTLREDRETVRQPPGQPGPEETDPPLRGRADRADRDQLTTLARTLSPVRLAAADSADAMHATVGLPEILGVPDVARLDTARTWSPRGTGDFLRVPIGVGPEGNPVLLDLKESAFGGMGPHGLVVGATGSGKSEMLRTLVASLVINHGPEQLALLLVDFKGGATFADTDLLPHSAGLITNLADDDSLVERFREAMFGELTRRQQALKDAGNLPNLHAYESARGRRPELEPLPHLLVIIDEFSELLTAHPDFAELFVAIGRIGRSIGVHLLLATQRLDSGKIKGLESHLSYRIGLRTFSEAESREAIGVGDAYHLPPEPGSGYLKVDTTVFERFKAAMVSQPYVPPSQDREEEVPQVLPLISFNGLASLTRPPGSVTNEDTRDGDGDGEEAPTTLRVTVDRLVASGAAPVRPVWLAPLPALMTLDGLLERLGEDLTGADGAPVEPDPAEARAIIGLADLPRDQAQTAADLDFTGGESNIVVLGGPQSGKSTLLRTLIASLAWRYPPGRIAVYAIDFGGGSLAPFEEVPHVAGVAGRSDLERTQRVLADVRGLLDQRERVFQRSRLDSPADLRQARAEGRVPSGVHGDVYLLIDGWAGVREALPDVDDVLNDIVSRGPALGVHTVLTASAGNQVRSKTQSLFGGRFELRLTDPYDSQLGRKVAERMPKDVPGRGLRSDESFVQVALPRLDGVAEDADLGDGVREAVRVLAERWPHDPVHRVRVLPAQVSLDELLPRHQGPGLLLGLGESDLGPCLYRPDEDPHLVVYGDPQTGKSNLIRTLVRQVAQRPAREVGIVMVDYRRAHLGLVPEDHLLAYSTSPQHTRGLAGELAGMIRQRLPGPEVTPRQLRERSWWDGLEVFVFVDDLDLVAGRSNPLEPLAEFLSQGADLGLHMVTARRTGGASRSMFDPVTQTIVDMATPGLLFSGDRMEGRLANGVASRRLPQGRALLARRGRPPEQVQVAWTEPEG
ncbi:S-DNA-T family DNA segregation ATPase FtsK/SpoIIIE [Nocardiopsis terrae]|uniref:S-DNA-T family DNA segregation ATPase FtsK/SpoIIIE n=2 Tax=Nocardiopsis terrae TaxID=372655 RepID=A0ABR9HGI2_9ACTN|nr:S-DNA-T family DNA segregation ATPase FtsK/SpoIIIE [Nocardiopsis terrae]